MDARYVYGNLRVALALTCVLAAVVPASAARAHDHRRPRAVLLVDSNRHALYHYESVWLYRLDEKSCIQDHEKNHDRFPQAIPVASSTSVVVRVRKPSAPTFISIQEWSRVDDDGAPAGQPYPVPFLVVPLTSGSNVIGWELVLMPTRQRRHHFVQVALDWRDEDGCHNFAPDLGSQWMIWRAHLKTR